MNRKEVIKGRLPMGRKRVMGRPCPLHLFLLAAALSLAWTGCSKGDESGLKAAGVVDGEIVTVKALALGHLVSLEFQEGDRVEKGAVLAEIESDKILNKIESLETGLKDIRINRAKLSSRLGFLETTEEYWKDQVSRLERLRASEAVSGDELERARLKLRETQASLTEATKSLESLNIQLEGIEIQRKGLDLQIKDTVLTAPIAGIILERYVSPGESILPGTSITEILDPDSLFVEVFLEEEELSSLILGQEVDITADGRPESFRGIISHFNRKAEFSPKYIVSERERRSLLFGVKVRVSEGRDVFKVGMPVTVTFR
jgi:HlyD family secretion protein